MIAAMTTPSLVHPGEVDWSGENPGMYLKAKPDGPFVTLVSFFRVVASPYGRGHALVLLEAPLLHRSLPEALNVCVTDNDPLARYLVSNFVAYFGAFKATEALPYMDYVPLEGVAASGDPRASYMENIPKEQSATGKHALHSLFVDARRATATVNGRPLKGQPVPREFAGRQSSTAFLAYSETWIKM